MAKFPEIGSAHRPNYCMLHVRSGGPLSSQRRFHSTENNEDLKSVENFVESGYEIIGITTTEGGAFYHFKLKA